MSTYQKDCKAGQEARDERYPEGTLAWYTCRTLSRTLRVVCLVTCTGWMDENRGQLFCACFRQHDTYSQPQVAKTGGGGRGESYSKILENWSEVDRILYFFPYHPRWLCWVPSLQDSLEVWTIPISFLILWLLLSQQSFRIPNAVRTAERK